jgi:hypothetical protein
MVSGRRLFFLAAFAACAGCGAKRGELGGTVYFQDKIVSSGTVQVVDSAGLPKSCAINGDGTYHIADILAGPLKVAVYSPDPGEVRVIRRKKENELPDPKDRSRWFRLPPDYEDFDKSGLTYDLQPGPNTWDIKLVEKP